MLQFKTVFHNCQFISHNRQLQVIFSTNSELTSCNFLLFSLNSEFTSQKFDLFPQNSEITSENFISQFQLFCHTVVIYNYNYISHYFSLFCFVFCLFFVSAMKWKNKKGNCDLISLLAFFSQLQVYNCYSYCEFTSQNVDTFFSSNSDFLNFCTFFSEFWI